MTDRSFISPFVAVTFFAVSITGILMLFHIKLGGIHAIHEWGGIAFVVGGSIHLILNWKAFTSYFKKSKAMYVVLAGGLIMLFALIASPGGGDGDYYHSGTTYSHKTRHFR